MKASNAASAVALVQQSIEPAPRQINQQIALLPRGMLIEPTVLEMRRWQMPTSREILADQCRQYFGEIADTSDLRFVAASVTPQRS